jgi:hypothetical protein
MTWEIRWPITYDECERQIESAIQLAVDLQTYTIELAKQAESGARLLEAITRALEENSDRLGEDDES